MNILVVCQHYYPEPFRINDLCESLVQRGHRVTVLTGLPNYPDGFIYNGFQDKERREELLHGVKVIRCPLIPRGNNRLMLFLNYISFAFSASLRALRLKDEYDVIFVQQTSPVFMAIPAIVFKKKYNKKILLYCMDPWPDSLAAGGVREGSLIYRLIWPISKWIYSSVDQLLVSSFSFIKYFEVNFGFNENTIEYLPQYAEDIFSNNKGAEEKTFFDFVFAGNVGKAQSVETIILAANQLKDQQDIMVHIVGSGSGLDSCQKLVRDLQLKNVIFHGRRPLEDMPYFYSMADAMLVTLRDSESFSSTLPGKVQSYMAAGKAIIGAANGETRRVVEESGCGLCCAAGDYMGLAEIMLDIYRMDSREKLSQKSRHYYEQYFSKERFMITLEQSLAYLGESNNV